MRIFISYKREEQATAESVRQHLESLGYQTWMDVHSIPSGVSWADAIEQGLRESDVVLGLMSERSIASPNVKNEWDYALVYGEKFNTRLILAKLDECVVPLNYVRLNWVDWRKGVDFSRLKTALDNPTPSHAANIPPAEKAYLEWLYHRLNTVLAAKIIFSDPANPDPIALVTERTRGAVDALFEKTPELDPLFAAMGLNNPDDSADYSSFGAAFDALDQRVLLLGEPGAGKTITLLHMARDAVVRRTQDPSAPLPLYAIIPYWDAYQHTDWLPWLQSQSMNKLPTLVDDYTQGRLLLVLDGLDELGNSRPIDPKKEDGPTFDPRLRFMAQLPAHNAVVVSCRIKDYHDIGQAIKLRGAITLQKLSTAQIESFLAKMPPLLEAIQSDDRLREMVETPLLLSLFAAGYRDSSEEELRALADLAHSPGDLRDKIFERYVQERYEHEARKYRLRGEQPPYSLEEVYERLGYVALGSATRDDKSIEVDMPRIDQHVGLMLFSQQINLLALHESDDAGQFIHLRLRDYFAFRFAFNILRRVEQSELKPISARYLGNLRDARIYPIFKKVLQSDTDWHVRAMCARGIGLSGDLTSTTILLDVMKHDIEPAVRAYAIRALGRLADPSTFEEITHTLAADSDLLYAGVMITLGRHNEKASRQLVEALKQHPNLATIFAKIALQVGSVTIADLLQHLESDDTGIQIACLWAIRNMDIEANNQEIRQVVIKYLNSQQHEVRLVAVATIERIGNPEDSKYLFQLLYDTSNDVKLAASHALGNLGNRDALPHLRQVLPSATSELETVVARAIAKIEQQPI